VQRKDAEWYEEACPEINFIEILIDDESRQGARAGIRAPGCFAGNRPVPGRLQPHTAGPRQYRWHVHCLDYLHKGVDVLAIRASSLHNALLVAKPSGYGSSNAQHEPTSHRDAAPR
jgi:hypothetical protein